MREKHSFQDAFTRADIETPFRYVPFEVPAGARRIEVSYHYDKLGAPPDEETHGPPPDNAIDIGIFDQRGVDFLTGGFRGWSGGARSGFYVATNGATPGYIGGQIDAGQWQVIIGCPVLASDTCRYWVDVSVDIDPEARADGDVPATRGDAAPPPASTGERRWYRGDLHSHTEHSDGYNTIPEYVREAGRRGLDFLAITDHNTTSHFTEIAGLRPETVLLIPGEEVTTAWGHANVWGFDGWVDFRCTEDGGMQRILDFVHKGGGLFSPNHPKVGYPWLFSGVKGYRVVEAWQGPWRFANSESLEFWERRLTAGERVTAVGGSDCHAIAPAIDLHPWTLGDPCTWAYAPAPLTERGVLDAVRAGHVFVSEDPTGPFLELTAECDGKTYLMGDEMSAAAGSPVTLKLRYRGPAEKKLRLYRDGGLWQEAVADGEDVTLQFELPLDGPGYVRAEAAGFRGRPERGEVVHALTNPIYLRPRT